MDGLRDLVERARSGDEAGRQVAFAALVVRFQDMAYACAYGVLGDHDLAQDAAQNAFLAAWLNLGRLRNAEAFPGWFRRIVLHQALRISRTRRLVVSLDRLGEAPVGELEADAFVERAEAGQEARRLLIGLPEQERVAMLLYYAGGHSQREVAGFLGVSVAAVKQRLHSARKRIRRRETMAMEDDLRANRPSRSDAFAERVASRLRSFAGDEYRVLAALIGAAEPGFPGDNAEWLANRQRFADEGLVPVSYVVEDPESGEFIGYGSIERLDLPEDGSQPPIGVPGSASYRVHLVAAPGDVASTVLAALYDRLERDAAALSAKRLWLRDYAHATAVLGLVADRGFSEVRRVQEWRFDAARNASPRSASSGLAISTLTQEQGANQAIVSELTQFWNAPGTPEPDVILGYEEVEARLQHAQVAPDSYFIARRQGRIAGALSLRRPHEATPDRPGAAFKVLADANEAAIGRALLSAASALCRSRGYAAITLHAATGTMPKGWLTNLGFRHVVEMVVMEKRLAPDDV